MNVLFSLLSIIKNKFFLATIAFIVWMLFFDNNNWFYLHQLASQAAQKRDDMEWYQKETEKISKEYQELSTSMEAMEKFAREKYFMKKPSEDVFVIIESSTKD